MRNYKRFWAISVTMTLLFASACSNGGNNEEKPQPSASNAQQQTDGEPFTKYDPPIKLTAAKVMYGDVQFKEGESLDNNVFDKTIQEQLGIEMDYLWTAADDNEFNERIRLALSAGEDLPDFLAISDPLLYRQLAQSGHYMEIGNLFDQNATSIWKDAFDKYPEAWNGVTIDGKRYGIPMFNWIGRNNVMWIREDWLNKLELKAPTTIDELEQVMDAFVNQDPDGNNEKDTYGISMALKENVLKTWLGSADFVFSAYGLPLNWQMGEDGKLVESVATPQMKEPLAKIASWIQKGYMPKDVGLYDEMKAVESWNSGKSGIVFGSYWLSIWPFPDLLNNDAGAEFKAYPLPKGPGGELAIGAEGLTNGRMLMVKKDIEHPEAIMHYMNWLYENYVSPEKGSEYEWGLAEGYDWAVVDGQPTNDKSKVPNYIDVVRVSLPKDILLPDDWKNMLTKFTSGGQPEMPMEIKQMGGEDERSLHAASVVLQQINEGYEKPNLAEGAPPTQTHMARGEMLETMWKDAVGKILYSGASPDSFDKFLEEYEKAGYGKVRDEMTEWYNSVNQ